LSRGVSGVKTRGEPAKQDAPSEKNSPLCRKTVPLKAGRQKPRVSGEWSEENEVNACRKQDERSDTMQFSHYDRVPQNIAQEIIEGKRR